MTKYTVDREKAAQLRELIEDTVEYFCDENMVSGELAWIMVECVAQAHQAKMRGECAS